MILKFPHITVLNIEHFSRIPIHAGEKRRIVNRMNSGLVFAPRGVIRYVQNGQSFLNDGGHVLLLPEQSSYTIECDEGDLCPLINFQCSEFFSNIMAFSFTDPEAALAGFDELAAGLVFHRSQNFCAAMAYLYDIFQKIITENPSEESKLPPLLGDAQQYIEQHYTDPALSAEDIAQHVNVSSVYFRRIFKEYHRQTPGQYLIGIRIRHAKTLLSNQIMAIDQIAACSGFSSIYTFSRAFRNAVGCSPTEYRRMCQNPQNGCGVELR